MNEENMEHRFTGKYQRHPLKKERDRVSTGIFLLIVGVILLLKTARIILFPTWFFDWPTLLIALGLFTGIKHQFRGGAWIILLLIGGLSLANRVDPSLNLDKYIWPIVIIAFGLLFLFKPKRILDKGDFTGQNNTIYDQANDTTPVTANSTGDRSDLLDITSIFSSIKKNIMSKTFRGGDIVCFMGGAEIDLTQADITGHIKIDTTNIFGGTKLIVPPTWDVQSDVTAVFGGVDDKRQFNGIKPEPDKVLILDGTCMFGGIEIRSF